MANEQTSDPDFKGMNREQLDEAAPDYGLDPAEFSKVDDLRAALVEAHEAKADTSDSDQGTNDDEIEALKAELERLRAERVIQDDLQAHDDYLASRSKSHSVDPVIHDATRDKPWITNDLAAGS